jgi:hypothetical protein
MRSFRWRDLVRDRRLGVRRVRRVLLDAADEIERGVKRLVILRIRGDIGLRAGLLVAFGLEVAAQRSLAAGVGARFELFRYLLQHLDVGSSMGSSPEPAVPAYRRVRMPRKCPQVLGVDLKSF